MSARQWGSCIDDYDQFLAAIGRPKTTRELRRSHLGHLCKSINMPLSEITEDDLIEWFALHDWKPETRRSYRTTVRGFFAWSYKSGRIVTDPAAELPSMKPGRAMPRPTPDHIWAQATMAADARVMLMLRLAGEAGLRRGEVARVHTRDLRYGPGGAQLLVHGKGRRERIVPITDELAERISAGAAGHSPGRSSTGWLFPGSDHGHLSPAWVGTLCSKVMPDFWTLHSARHRFASRAYRGTRNIRAVQELLGHSSVAMTEKYTAVDSDEMRAAMVAAVA